VGPGNVHLRAKKAGHTDREEGKVPEKGEQESSSLEWKMITNRGGNSNLATGVEVQSGGSESQAKWIPGRDSRDFDRKGGSVPSGKTWRLRERYLPYHRKIQGARPRMAGT